MPTFSEIAENAIAQSYKIHKNLVKRSISSYRRVNGGDNWSVFCLFYLEAVEKLAKELPETIDENDTSLEKKRALIIPSFFLFKHTLELVLKFIQISFTNEIGSHDVEDIRKKIQFTQIQKKIKFKDVSKTYTKSVEETKLLIKEQIEVINELIEDYFFGVFLSQDHENMNYILVDKQNELYRYPITNNVIFQIDPLSLYNASPLTIKKLKNDINKLKKVYEHFFIVIQESNLL